MTVRFVGVGLRLKQVASGAAAAFRRRAATTRIDPASLASVAFTATSNCGRVCCYIRAWPAFLRLSDVSIELCMHSDDRHVIYESAVPFDANRIRAAAVYCSDGRFGDQFDDLLQNVLQLPRYDRLAVPGGSACLARHFVTYREDEGVFEQLRFLVAVHDLERVVLIAHENCAFYSERLRISPLQLESQQRDDIRKAAERVRSLSKSLRVDAFFARKYLADRIQFEKIGS